MTKIRIRIHSITLQYDNEISVFFYKILRCRNEKNTKFNEIYNKNLNLRITHIC